MNTLSSMVEFINQLLTNDSIKCLVDSKVSLKLLEFDNCLNLMYILIQCLEPFHTIVINILRLKKKLKSNDSKEIEIKIFISLNSMSTIQLFEEYEEIQNIIPVLNRIIFSLFPICLFSQDLNECMKRAINEESVEEDSGPVWSDVLTDLILSMLTTTSKLTKNVLFSCFKQICTQITNTGIQHLVDAIIPSNDNKLFAGNEDSDEEDEEVEDEEREGNEGDSESDSDSEDENENKNQEIDEKFRNDVIVALGPAAYNDDDEVFTTICFCISFIS